MLFINFNLVRPLFNSLLSLSVVSDRTMASSNYRQMEATQRAPVVGRYCQLHLYCVRPHKSTRFKSRGSDQGPVEIVSKASRERHMMKSPKILHMFFNMACKHGSHILNTTQLVQFKMLLQYKFSVHVFAVAWQPWRPAVQLQHLSMGFSGQRYLCRFLLSL